MTERDLAFVVEKLLTRLATTLPTIVKGKHDVEACLQDQLGHDSRALVQLSNHRINGVCDGLARIFTTDLKSPALTRDLDDTTAKRLAHVRLFTLRFLHQCLERWVHLHSNDPTRLRPDSAWILTESYLLPPTQPPPDLPPNWTAYVDPDTRRVFYHKKGETTCTFRSPVDKDQLVAPMVAPPLDEPVARAVLDLIVDVHHKAPPHLQESMEECAQKIACSLSVSNLNTFLHVLNEAEKEEQMDFPLIRLLHSVTVDLERIRQLFTCLVQVAPRFHMNAKASFPFALRQIIWNFIHRHPREFASALAGGYGVFPDVEALFDLLSRWAMTPKYRQGCWPVMGLLLAASPDVVLGGSPDTPPLSKKFSAFLDTVSKGMKDKYNVSSAIRSFVDIACVSVYETKGKQPLQAAIATWAPDLLGRFFDFVSHSQGGLDVQDIQETMIDYIVCQYRLLGTGTSILRRCLGNEAPRGAHSSLVKALIRLRTEGTFLPWLPNVTDAYRLLCSPMKTLFQESLQQERDAEKEKERVEKDKKKSERGEKGCLTDLIELFGTDPDLAFSFAVSANNPQAGAVQLSQTCALLTGLCSCVADLNDRSLSEKALSVLLKFHQPEYMAKWVVGDSRDTVLEISSAVHVTLATVLMESKPRPWDLHVLDILVEIVSRGNDYLRTLNKSYSTFTTLRIQAHACLEKAIILQFCDLEPEKVAKAGTLLSLLLDTVDILGEWKNVMSPFVANYHIYRKLGPLDLLARTQQHRAIRATMRQLCHRTQGSFSAWLEMYQRWQTLTTQLLKGGGDVTAETDPKKSGGFKTALWSKKTELQPESKRSLAFEIKPEWQTYLGFLCALGGFAFLILKMGARNPFSRGCTIDRDGVAYIDEFVKHLVDLLATATDNVFIREMVVASLGNMLSPFIFVSLFQQINQTMASFFGQAGQVNIREASTAFVDATISIVKQILEQPPGSTVELALVDLETLTLYIMRYVSHLPLADPLVLRMKSKLCYMVDVLFLRAEVLSLSNANNFRNRLLEHMMEWTSDFARNSRDVGSPVWMVSIGEGGGDTPARPSDAQNRLFHDVDVACLSGIGSILHGFAIDHDEGGSGILIRNRESRPKSVEVCAQLFFKYFSFLSSILRRIKGDDSSSGESLNIRALCNAALRNLMHANMPTCISYYYTLVFHDVVDIRTVFLEVLASYLNQGMDFDERLEEKEDDAYKALKDLLFSQDLTIPLVLCDVVPINEADSVAKALIRLFESNGMGLKLLNAVISTEVKRTTAPATLFRSSSMASRMMSVFSHMVGKNFLKRALGPVLNNLLARMLPVEVNPVKLSPEQAEFVGQHMQNLLAYCGQFLDCIMNSLDIFPLEVRAICRHVYAVVGERFPGYQHVAVSGLVILRFINPAIVSPDMVGICEEDRLFFDARRALVLISKVIQNLANGVKFGVKEEFMAPANAFIDEWGEKIKKFFDKLVQLPSHVEESVAEGVKEEDLHLVHVVLSRNMEALAASLQSATPHSVPSIGSSNRISLRRGSSVSSVRSPLERLYNAVQALGPPPEMPRAKGVMPTPEHLGSEFSTPMFEKFMRRYFDEDMEELRKLGVFYKNGRSKGGQTTFYFIARRFDKDMDTDKLIYFVLKTLQPHWKASYEIVFDGTLTPKDAEVYFPTTILRLGRLMPSGALENIGNTYFVNPNTPLQKLLKKMVHRFYSSKKLVMVGAPSRLLHYIEESSLPEETIKVETDVQAVFSPVSRVYSIYKHSSVTVRTSPDFVQILSSSMLFNSDATFIDLLPVSGIQDVDLLGRDKDALVVKYRADDQSCNLTFRTSAAPQIVQAIRASIIRQKHTAEIASLQKEQMPSSRMLRPTDIPGYLLNTAMVNLLSSSEATRKAAYNFLAQICATFNLSVQLEFLDVQQGLYIPPNSAHFVVGVSNRLASSDTSLTADFVISILHDLNMTPAFVRPFCLEYLAPWLFNIESFAQAADREQDTSKSEKMKELLNLLAEDTFKHHELYPVFLAKVWTIVGTLAKLLSYALDTLIARAVESGITGDIFESIVGIVVTLASRNPKLVSSTLISRLVKSLEKTSISPTDFIDEHPIWPETVVLLRFVLMLSFQNLIHVQKTLPDLLHVITSLFAMGDPAIRATVHSLALNTMHTLYTTQGYKTEQLENISSLLSQFTEPRIRSIFQYGVTNPAAVSYQTKRMVSVTDVDVVVSSLYDLFECCCYADSSASVEWYNHWLSLAEGVAFVPNPSLQPRAFVTLGTVTISSDAERLLVSCVKVLKDILLRSMHADENNLPTSIILCLARLFPRLPSTKSFLKDMYWLAIMLLEAASVEMYPSVVQLLEAVLFSLDPECTSHRDRRSLEAHLLPSKQEDSLEDHVGRLESLIGVRFRTQLSFSMGACVLKGLNASATKGQTLQFLQNLCEMVARCGSLQQSLGYITVLLAYAPEEKGEEIRRILFANDVIVTKDLVPSTEVAGMFISLLLSILKGADRDFNQMNVYRLLREGMEHVREAVLPFDYLIVPKLTEIMSYPPNQHVYETVLAIFQTLLKESAGVQSPTTPQHHELQAFLASVGFGGFLSLSTFERIGEKRIACGRLAVEFMEDVLARHLKEKAAATTASSKPRDSRFRS